MFTFGSLFAGIGGLDLGLERAGMACCWQVEIDAKCNDVLAHHWPDVQRYGDVRDVGRSDLEPVDVIVGGFPCQDVSIAGKREGLVGSRSGLWFEFLRVLEELRPKWVVVENVPGLLSSNGGRDFAVILQGLAEFGYLSAWRVLDAQYYGLAQRRKRVFIVSSLGDGSCSQILFESESLSWDSAPSREARPGITAPLKAGSPSRRGGGSWPIAEEFVVARPLAFGSTIDHYDESQQTYVPVTANTLGSHHGRNDQDSMGAYIAGTLHKGIPGRDASDAADGKVLVAYNWQSGGDVRLSFGLPNLQANQVPTVGVRRLTPMECERLQGFPDGWTAINDMSDSARYRMLGNAVAVPKAEWIGAGILEIVANET